MKERTGGCPGWGEFSEGREELRRDGVGEPDAVGGDEEVVAGGGHAGGGDLEHDRLAVAGPDAGRGLGVGGEVDVVAVHLRRPSARIASSRASAVPWKR